MPKQTEPSSLSGLLDGLSREQREAIVGQVRGLEPEQLKVLLKALHAEALQRCAKDGLLWLKFVKTRDEADPDESAKFFPVEKEYIRVVWRILEDPANKRIIIAKSRQMVASWIMAAFACWWCRFKPNQHVIIQTQKEEDADKLVCMAGGRKAAFLGRCQFIERNLPSWMRVESREEGGKLGYVHNGSLIEAFPGGADQIRSKVPSLIIEDEFAYQTDAWGVYTACNPLVQKGAKMVLISTPAGRDGNCFASLWFGVGKYEGR